MKFWINNKDIFLRYFKSEQEYDALIKAGNDKKMQRIVAENTQFNSIDFLSKIEREGLELLQKQQG